MLNVEVASGPLPGPEMVRRRGTVRVRGGEKRVPEHPTVETLVVAALHGRAQPPSAGHCRRRENVMQSTYGSSPRGPLP
jgi:hypothetical protein